MPGKRYVVGGCSTYAKTLFAGVAGYPQHLCGGGGATVWQKWGLPRYIDWTANHGATVLGHQPIAIEDAVDGYCWNLPLPHPLEEEAAALLCQATGWERLRWCKNGSDAIEAAVRIARYVTGRDGIVTNSYHGSHDCVLAATPGKKNGLTVSVRAWVWPVQTAVDFDEVMTVERIPAAVVLDPKVAEQQGIDLGEVRRVCTQQGIILVFDEVVTGFRCRYGSAVPDVQPDLAVYGKAIASGFPLACLVGRTDLMDLLKEEVYMSGTNASEILSLAACKATLLELAKKDYFHVEMIGVPLQNALREWVTGYPQRLTFAVDEKKLRLIVGALAEEGILVGREWFPMFAHTYEDIDKTIEAIYAVRDDLGND